MYEIGDDVEALADDADASATAGGNRFDDARKSLTAVMDRGRDICELAAREARAADHAMHAHLYKTILIGIGVGVILGYFVARQSTCDPD